MFIELKKEIITEAVEEDFKLIQYARTQKNYWSKEDNQLTKNAIERHFTRIDYIIDEFRRQNGETVATYTQSTELDVEKLKREEPEAFEKCSEPKVNIKLLEGFFPELVKKYRKPSYRSLRIVA